MRKLNDWLAVLAIFTLLSALIPLAPREALAFRDSSLRNENVLRTSGLARTTRNCHGCMALSNDNGQLEPTAAEAAPTDGIAELNVGDEDGDGDSLNDSQAVRVRGVFFKNSSNPTLPGGGAAKINRVWFMVRDRYSQAWQYIAIGRGANNVWDTGGALLDDTIQIYGRSGPRFEASATSCAPGCTGPTSVSPIDAGATALGSYPVVGSGGAPHVQVLLAELYGAAVEDYGIPGGGNGEILNVSFVTAFRVPDSRGPIEIWSAVEDEDGYAAGWDLGATVQLGTPPTASPVALTKGNDTAAIGSELTLTVAVDDRDSERDVRAAIIFLVSRTTGTYVALIFYNWVGIPEGSFAAASEIEQKFQVYDSQRGVYSPALPKDRGTILTSLGTLNVDASTKTSAGDRLTANFRFSFSSAARGLVAVYGQGVDREMQPSNLVLAGNLNVQ
ncbi:MAG: hypothetical protein HY329_14075 [Chloroflexi bacterium]|nr:hypothetical protein [Chloroflexota bacterium]